MEAHTRTELLEKIEAQADIIRLMELRNEQLQLCIQLHKRIISHKEETICKLRKETISEEQVSVFEMFEQSFGERQNKIRLSPKYEEMLRRL